MSLNAEDLEPDGFSGFFPEQDEFAVSEGVQSGGRWALKRELQAAYRGTFGARMYLVGGSTIGLKAYTSTLVEVDGELLDLCSGVDGPRCGTGDSLINSQGGETGVAPGSSTLYYAYVSNANGSLAPSGGSAGSEGACTPRLRLSATAPSFIQRSALGGVSTSPWQQATLGKYLGQTDQARRWRFVGWVYTTSGSGFADSDTQRFVANYYNRIKKRLFPCPAYNNNNAVTTFTLNSGSWTAMNGGTGAKLEYISNGEDSVHFHASMSKADAGGAPTHAIAFEEGSANNIVAGKMNIVAGTYGTITVSYVAQPGEGYRYVQFMGRNSVSHSIHADQGRNGASADVPESFICAEVMT